MGKLTESMTRGDTTGTIDDGHDMPWMAANKPGPRGSSGANHTGRLQAFTGSDLDDGDVKDSGTDNDDSRDVGVGSMEMREMGDMARNAYGADLRPDAINRIAKFDADSDSSDTHRLLPRNASGIL